ncbi:hypothetical protein [Kibdelosporangium philippinense]|uniref:hypothetical protein n=1 Tax=Kibdelosporangium philippinense TaxID=211113 RepID=UPI003614C3F3
MNLEFESAPWLLVRVGSRHCPGPMIKSYDHLLPNLALWDQGARPSAARATLGGTGQSIPTRPGSRSAPPGRSTGWAPSRPRGYLCRQRRVAP